MKRFFTLLFLFITGVSVHARQDEKVNIICGPYITAATETSFTVTWVTDMDAVTWVEVAPDDGTHFYNRNRERFYDASGHGVLPIGKIHKVEIDGLEPGTRYRYRLMTKGVISYERPGEIRYTKTLGTNVYKGKPYEASTFRKEYDTLRFDMYNDIHAEQPGNDSLFNIVLKGSKENCDFVLLNGDFTSHISKESHITDMYLKTLADNLNGEVPVFAARGNHELRGRYASKWLDYFPTPTGAPYYSFRIGKIFFVVIDACEDKPDNDIEYNGIVASEQYMRRQEAWLKKALASDECKNAEVRIAISHVAPEAKGWYGMAQLCERLVPHLNEAEIDAMFCGHIHRWRVSEPDGSLSNAAFPVICNPNIQRMEVTVTNRKIDIKTFNHKGTNTNSHTINLK